MARKRRYYILDGHTPVRELDESKWAEWYKTANTIVEEDLYPEGIRIVTVFTGEDLFRGNVPTRPFLFHTYAYGGELEDGFTRGAWSLISSSWEDAEDMQYEMRVRVAQYLEYCEEESAN